MSEPLTLYKLIVLYMLTRVNFPLTNSQISNFVLDAGYTTYFTLQQTFSELIESSLIRSETIRNSSYYYITDAGKETLGYFEHMISKSIQKDIDDYLKKHRLELRDEVSVTSDFYRTTNGDYAVQCKVTERNSSLIELTLTVPDKEQASSLCANWKERCQEIYANLMKELM